MLAAGGPIAQLNLRTLLSGDPWTSDFGVWLRRQPPEAADDMEDALHAYLATHGPGRWAFDQPER